MNRRDLIKAVLIATSWEYPKQENDELTITQTFLATQNNAILEVE